MRFRHALLPRISEWRQPTMITLTVDRSGWPDGAESVWEHVSSKSLVARLMRRLGIDRWLWVVEWQSASGEGWPHWHVLVDWPGFVDYREVRRLWWGLWNIGNIDVKPVGARGGIWYLSAYMTKGCSKHPQWILERRQTVRKCGGSKAMGPLLEPVGDPTDTPDTPDPPDAGNTEPAPSDGGRPDPPPAAVATRRLRPIREGVASCKPRGPHLVGKPATASRGGHRLDLAPPRHRRT